MVSVMTNLRKLNKAAPPNRRPRFAFAALLPFNYCFCAPPASPAAVGEARRWAI
jgi:hypothetical protein